jgi:hypothetical protein
MSLLHSSDPKEFDNALSNVVLSPLQQSIVTGRYVQLVKHLRGRTARVSLIFHSSRIVITVGSLIVPALLSIQGAASVNTTIYWATWVVSLLVTICNALMALFKFDKRYYYLHTILEKLVSEGWQYVELTGKYSGYNTPGHAPTHENQFIYFCHAIEKIRMKQVEEEYYKLSESQSQTTQVQAATESKSSLIPPTPQQADFATIPTELAEAVKSEIAKSNIGDAEEDTADKKNGSPQSVSVSFNM